MNVVPEGYRGVTQLLHPVEWIKSASHSNFDHFVAQRANVRDYIYVPRASFRCAYFYIIEILVDFLKEPRLLGRLSFIPVFA